MSFRAQRSEQGNEDGLKSSAVYSGNDSITIDGVGTALATALAAFTSAKSISVLYDNSGTSGPAGLCLAVMEGVWAAAFSAASCLRSEVTQARVMSALAKSTSLILSLALCSALPTVDARTDDPNAVNQDEPIEPIVIDEEPEAFFVAAPQALAAKMRRALTDACVGTTRPSLFCDGTPLRFLREVSVYGNKHLYGFACTKGSLYPRNKYFTPDDIRSKSTCVYINCLSIKKPCDVDRDQLMKAGNDS